MHRPASQSLTALDLLSGKDVATIAQAAGKDAREEVDEIEERRLREDEATEPTLGGHFLGREEVYQLVDRCAAAVGSS